MCDGMLQLYWLHPNQSFQSGTKDCAFLNMSSSLKSGCHIKSKLIQITALHFALNFLHSDMAHIASLDHVDHVFGHVLGMVAYALNCLGDKQDFQRAGNSARVFHHEGDEVTHDDAELLIHLLILTYYLCDSGNIQFGKSVQRLEQHVQRKI